MAEKPSTYTKRWLGLNNGLDQVKINSMGSPKECPHHLQEFFMREHDMCRKSALPKRKKNKTKPNQAEKKVKTQQEMRVKAQQEVRIKAQQELRMKAMQDNPHLVYSHNDPWSEDRAERFDTRAKQQYKYNNPVAPKATVTLHANPFPNQFGSLPDVAPMADSTPRHDGRVSMEMVCPDEYRRAGVNFFIN